MGACSSCLGLRHKSSDPETSRLLDDPYRAHYGAAGQSAQRPIPQPDLEAQRREREALEGICHAMSDEVVDVFSVLPMPDEGASGPGRVQGGDWRPETPATSADGYKPSPVSLKQYKAEDREPSPQEMAYRSVRKARIPARSTSPKDEQQWKAAKAVME